jgi:hypothetical protein
MVDGRGGVRDRAAAVSLCSRRRQARATSVQGSRWAC